MFLLAFLAGLLGSVITLSATTLFCLAVIKYTNRQNELKRSSVIELADVDEPVPYKFVQQQSG